MDERSDKNYKALAFIPMLTFLGLYVGCGVVFTIMGTENPFGKMPRYVAVMAAIVIAMIFYDRNTPISKKIDIYCKGNASGYYCSYGRRIFFCCRSNGWKGIYS